MIAACRLTGTLPVFQEIVSLAPVHSDAHACMKAGKRCATTRGGGTS